jgi:MYXO-CTERM domain-containing protein
MANAANSVVAADRPIAAIAVPANVSAGQNVTLDATGSAAACNRTLASFAWVVTQPASNAPPITGANTASATVVAPATGSVTLKLTVTDDQGHSDSANVVIGTDSATTAAPANAGNTACIAAITSGPTPMPGGSTPTPTPTPTPQPSSSGGGGGGGGGSLEVVTLGLLGLVAIGSRRRRAAAHFSRCI